MSLLGKWAYKWSKDRHRSWNKWVRSKYDCSVHGSLLDDLDNKQLSDTMQGIKSAAEDPMFKQMLAGNKFIWKVGCGLQVMFWEDAWSEGVPLKTKFKKLYSLSTLKLVSIPEFLQHWGTNSQESLWTRALRSWELDELKSLEIIIDGVILTKESDTLIWLPSQDQFSVKKASEILRPEGQDVRWKFIWKLKIPQKIKFFLWKTHLSILPTKDILVARGVKLVGATYCPICELKEETSQHLLVECGTAMKLWEEVLKWWGLPADRFQYTELILRWKLMQNRYSKKLEYAWKTVVSATLWSIWLCRNQAIFRKQKFDFDTLFSMVHQFSKEWCIAFGSITQDSVKWWLSNPVGSVTNSEKQQLERLRSTNAEFIGFIDGSQKMTNSISLAGIGGIVMDKKENVFFTFSGPVSASSPSDTEWKALRFLIFSFAGSKWGSKSIRIYSDSINLVNNFLQLQVATNNYSDPSLHKLVSSMQISIKFIPRELNTRADLLAKRGARRPDMALFWR